MTKPTFSQKTHPSLSQTGDYPGRAGFWQRQSAVPSRAHKSLSLSTCLVSWGHHRTSIYILFCLSLSFFIFLSVKP